MRPAQNAGVPFDPLIFPFSTGAVLVVVAYMTLSCDSDPFRNAIRKTVKTASDSFSGPNGKSWGGSIPDACVRPAATRLSSIRAINFSFKC